MKVEIDTAKERLKSVYEELNDIAELVKQSSENGDYRTSYNEKLIQIRIEIIELSAKLYYINNRI